MAEIDPEQTPAGGEVLQVLSNIDPIFPPINFELKREG